MLAQINLQDVTHHGPAGVAASLVLVLGWVVRYLAGELRRERDKNDVLTERLAVVRVEAAEKGVELRHLEEVTGKHTRTPR